MQTKEQQDAASFLREAWSDLEAMKREDIPIPPNTYFECLGTPRHIKNLLDLEDFIFEVMDVYLEQFEPRPIETTRSWELDHSMRFV